ncbi:MAG TPA: DUF1801 domain-containing protein [Vicinamibacterales bacterium]|nr:DUF1801 domain-containing protein [Vicinamibacterales bacterium]
MKPKQAVPTTIDEYIAGFPPNVRRLLRQVRATIRKAAPKAEEKISYQIPTLFLHGNLVHFGAFKEHIGFYPAPMGLKEFEKELSKYAGSKGSVRFPLDQPMPLGLITRIVKFRVKKNLERAAGKK